MNRSRSSRSRYRPPPAGGRAPRRRRDRPDVCAEQPPAQQLLARRTDDRADRLVDAQEAAFGVELDDADRGMLVGRRPALLLLAQLALAAIERIDHALALGDVLEAVDGADELALRIDQRIDVEQHRRAACHRCARPSPPRRGSARPVCSTSASLERVNLSPSPLKNCTPR